MFIKIICLDLAGLTVDNIIIFPSLPLLLKMSEQPLWVILICPLLRKKYHYHLYINDHCTEKATHVCITHHQRNGPLVYDGSKQ